MLTDTVVVTTTVSRLSGAPGNVLDEDRSKHGKVRKEKEKNELKKFFFCYYINFVVGCWQNLLLLLLLLLLFFFFFFFTTNNEQAEFGYVLWLSDNIVFDRAGNSFAGSDYDANGLIFLKENEPSSKMWIWILISVLLLIVRFLLSSFFFLLSSFFFLLCSSNMLTWLVLFWKTSIFSLFISFSW